jgi:hypothetical protein
MYIVIYLLLRFVRIIITAVDNCMKEPFVSAVHLKIKICALIYSTSRSLVKTDPLSFIFLARLPMNKDSNFIWSQMKIPFSLLSIRYPSRFM